MALMKYRERNMAKWRGVRPAHNGEQVIARGTVENNTSTVYTVGAGKVFFLCAASFSFANQSAATATGKAWVDTAGPLDVYRFFYAHLATINSQNMHCCFNPPMELPAGYLIRVYSSILLGYTTGNIFGWLEDA